MLLHLLCVRNIQLERLSQSNADVTSDTSVNAMTQRVTAEFGELHVLVNNAGYGAYGSVEKTSLEVFRQNMDT